MPPAARKRPSSPRLFTAARDPGDPASVDPVTPCNEARPRPRPDAGFVPGVERFVHTPGTDFLVCTQGGRMITFDSDRSETGSRGRGVALRGLVVAVGAALLLAGCGNSGGPASSAPVASAPPAASAPAASAPVAVPTAAPASATSVQAAADQEAGQRCHDALTRGLATAARAALKGCATERSPIRGRSRRRWRARSRSGRSGGGSRP